MLSGGKSSDTATATFLDEGARTVGVWAPIALADIYAALVAMIRLWIKDPEKIKVPERSQTLASWCLPMLSRSLKADEDERDALALFNAVKDLAASRQKNTEANNNG